VPAGLMVIGCCRCRGGSLPEVEIEETEEIYVWNAPRLLVSRFHNSLKVPRSRTSAQRSGEEYVPHRDVDRTLPPRNSIPRNDRKA
jgi:hypothetical protein